MKNITVIKIGNMVKISLAGKLKQKNCGSPAEADELFRLCLDAKENPTDEKILNIRAYLNERTRVAMMAGLEHDPETSEVFMAGFNTPVPDGLVEIIKDYHENGYPMQPLLNFWKLLMLNPDTRVRTDLFDFITAHDFSLTDNGYMVVYKAVYDATEGDTDTSFAEFVSSKYLHVKKTWKESPKNYVVYRSDDDEFAITNVKTANKWKETEKEIEFMGNLNELFDAIFSSKTDADTNVPVYTDMHSRSMRIELGTPVKQDRKDCDADYRNECSNGLHVGATAYVERFANWHSGENRAILVCYVNPANVVAVPQYDHSKMRVAEYFPFAIANWDGEKIDVVEQAYFPADYTEYEVEELEKLVLAIQAKEVPIAKAINCENDEMRPLSELQKIIESRLVDLDE